MLHAHKIFVYKQRVEHKVLSDAIRSKREHIVCILNKEITRFPLKRFMDGDFVARYETYITKIDELLIIELLNKSTQEFDNKIILKSREPGCEEEFKLEPLTYYNDLHKKIREDLKIFDE